MGKRIGIVRHVHENVHAYSGYDHGRSLVAVEGNEKNEKIPNESFLRGTAARVPRGSAAEQERK